MKKNISIITLNGSKPNYGNKLQNFATIKKLQGYDYKIATLDLREKKNRFVILKIFINFLLRHDEYFYYKKLYKFSKFEKKYLHYRKTSSGMIKKTDIYIVGSDQVWNSDYWTPNSKQYYLGNFDYGKDKIALCVSVGCPIEKADSNFIIEKNARNFKKVSCREQDITSFLNRSYGDFAITLIDPVLSLKKEEWQKYIKKPSRTLNNFGIIYFVGEKCNNIPSDLLNEIKSKKIELININDITNSYDPFEFLYLISKSRLVLTNSYHAAVFSFIFDTPFVVFKRTKDKDMYVRFTNFLNTFNLSSKCLENLNMVDLFNSSYDDGKSVLELEIEKFDKFISSIGK